MRLWHYKLIPYLPRTQLIAQWRELNSIFKKQDNHILINYIYNYDKEHLLNYSVAVIGCLIERGYNINKWENFNEYFQMDAELIIKLNTTGNMKAYGRLSTTVFEEHNNEYLQICIYNLKEKYIRGQKDFSKEQYDRIMETF